MRMSSQQAYNYEEENVMKRKILFTFILTLLMTAFSTVAFASENNIQYKYTKAYALLEALGAVSEYDSEAADTPVTRGEFVDMFVKTIGINNSNDTVNPFSDMSATHPYKNSVACAYANGYVGGYEDGTFCPDDAILLGHGKSIARKALGVNSETENFAQYINEIEHNLQIGLTVKNDETITEKDAVLLLYNMLMSETMTYSIPTEQMLFEETLASKLYDIYEGKGQVQANAYTSLESTTGAGKGNVRIGNVVFRCDEDKLASYNKYLGYSVEYFAVSKKGDSPELLCLVPSDKNNDLYITCYELPDNCFDGNVLTYRKEGTDKVKEAKISTTATFNYNGVYYGSQIERSAFDIELGDITLIDCDDDDVYDFVSIMSYEVLVAGNFINDKIKRIHDQYTYDNYVELDSSDPNVIIDVEINGKKASVLDIMTNDCLSYAVGKDGDETVIVTVKINREVVSGKIERFNNKYVLIEGKEYIVSDHAKIKPAERGDDLRVGKVVTAHLDYLNQVAVIFDTAESEFSYGFLMDVVESDPGSDGFIFVCYTLGSDFAKLETGNSVRINGQKYKSLQAIKDELLTSKLSEFSQFSDKMYQVVKFKTNDGKLTDIYTTASEDERAPSLDFDFETRYYKNSGEFGNRWRDFYARGYFMFIPSPDAEGNLDRTRFYVCKADAITNGGTYYIAGYDCDEYRNSEFQLVKFDDTEVYPTTPNNYLVLENELIVDDDGEIRRRFKLAYKAVEYVLTTLDPELGADVNPGDIINCVENADKYIVFMRKVIDMNAKVIKQGFNNVTAQGYYMQNNRHMLGYLVGVDEGQGIVTYNKDLSSDPNMDPGMGVVKIAMNFTVYNMENQEARYETFDCWPRYVSTTGTDYLLYIYESYGSIQDVIVYEL